MRSPVFTALPCPSLLSIVFSPELNVVSFGAAVLGSSFAGAGFAGAGFAGSTFFASVFGGSTGFGGSEGGGSTGGGGAAGSAGAGSGFAGSALSLVDEQLATAIHKVAANNRKIIFFIAQKSLTQAAANVAANETEPDVSPLCLNREPDSACILCVT